MPVILICVLTAQYQILCYAQSHVETLPFLLFHFDVVGTMSPVYCLMHGSLSGFVYGSVNPPRV